MELVVVVPGTISQKRSAGPPRRCEDPAHGRVSLSSYGY